MGKSNQSATSLIAFVNQVISDLGVTLAEYRDIIDLAHHIGIIEEEEKTLIFQFHPITSNDAFKRVPD